MKKFLLFATIILFCFCFQNCRTAKVPYNAMVTNVSDPDLTSGLIHLHSAGKGFKEEDAISDAEKNAFNAILFVGVPASPQERPMLPDESSAKSSNASFFQNFFDAKGYRNFITSISNNGFTKDSDGKKITTIDVKINLNALRNNLENNHVIKKFGL